MRYRLLGPTGLRVSQLFLGAMTLTDTDQAGRMLDLYADAGGNVIDTASAYGDSEQILGDVLRQRRDRFVLATKYTLTRQSTDPNAGGNHRKNLTLSLERSLRRLNTDHVDLLWVHVWDEHTPVEETMRALDDAVRAGKVLYVGASNLPAWVVSRANTLAQWRDWTPFAGVQVPYNPLARDIERELLPMAENLGLSVATYAGLAGGVLSGKYTRPGGAPPGSRVDPASLTERDHQAARTVDHIAQEVGATPSQIAIAWALARSPAVPPHRRRTRHRPAGRQPGRGPGAPAPAGPPAPGRTGRIRPRLPHQRRHRLTPLDQREGRTPPGGAPGAARPPLRGHALPSRCRDRA